MGNWDIFIFLQSPCLAPIFHCTIYILAVLTVLPTSNLLADPGEARCCSTNTFVIDKFSQSVSLFLTTPKRSSYKKVIKNFLNPEGHQNPSSGSKFTALLLKGLIWPIGGVASGRVCACSLHSRLVYLLFHCCLEFLEHIYQYII